jgi:uncharacterized protein YjiS (DUF1127 family)
MSCGSTTCNSTNTLDAASRSVTWKIPRAWLDGIALRWERRRQYGQLRELDDHLLADIGLSRIVVDEARRSYLYMIAWRDSR